MIRVAALPSDYGGCGFYRIIQPLEMLQKQGHIDLLMRSVTHNGQKIPAIDHDAFEWADVIVVQKTGNAELTPLLREHSRKCVFDVDDDLDAITKDNPAYTEDILSRPGLLGRIRDNLTACSTATVTTNYLAGVIGKRHNNVKVIPNGIDLDLWSDRRAVVEGGLYTNQVRIGYVASRNHVQDSQLLLKPFKRLAAKYSNVTFVMAGAYYIDLKRALGKRLEFHGGVDIDSYPQWYRSLNLDIAVAPLIDSVFARSKSNLKWLEASAAGIPLVASPVGPYNDTYEECNSHREQPGLWIPKDSDSVNSVFDLLIENQDLRTMTAGFALQSVKNRYLVSHSAAGWLGVLSSIANPSRLILPRSERLVAIGV